MLATEAQLLHRALSALDGGDTPRARAALLEAWRAARSPAVADLVSLLDSRQPDDLPRALGAVLAPRVSATLERLTPLVDVDDPRVSAFALSALQRLPFTTPGALSLLSAFVRVVRARRDARLLLVAPAIREGLRTRLTRAPVRDALLAELDDAVRALHHLAPASTPDALALCDALRARLAPLAPLHSEEALLAAVHAHPHDDGPRLVYADWLLERGEPRGEFITLQFKRRSSGLSKAEAKRETELLKKHGRSWLGALVPVVAFRGGVATTKFERGFLSEADIVLSAEKKLAPLWDADEWRTVEHLAGSWPLELLWRAPLGALRSVDGTIGTDTLAALTRGRHVLDSESVELAEDVCAWGLVRAVFPRLRAVSVRCSRTPTLALLEHYAKANLHRLELRRYRDTPRDGDAIELARLLEALRAASLPFPELALAPGPPQTWPDPPLMELRPVAGGHAVS